MIIIKGRKQPWERKDWDVNGGTGSDWLLPGDSFVSATATVECLTTPSDTELVIETPSALEVSSPYIKVWTTGGTTGHKYKITVRAITAADRRVEVEIIITVKDE